MTKPLLRNRDRLSHLLLPPHTLVCLISGSRTRLVFIHVWCDGLRSRSDFNDQDDEPHPLFSKSQNKRLVREFDFHSWLLESELDEVTSGGGYEGNPRFHCAILSDVVCSRLMRGQPALKPTNLLELSSCVVTLSSSGPYRDSERSN